MHTAISFQSSYCRRFRFVVPTSFCLRLALTQGDRPFVFTGTPRILLSGELRCCPVLAILMYKSYIPVAVLRAPSTSSRK